MKRVLVVGGDVGGASCLMAALPTLRALGIPLAVVRHGYLAGLSLDWGEEQISFLPDREDSVNDFIGGDLASSILFSTSVKDAFPLKLARRGREAGLPAICVLDNWMNYRLRLEIDDGPTFYPDVYALMDEYALAEAADKEGLPRSCLKVTGHLALSSLADEWGSWTEENGRNIFEQSSLDSSLRRLVFVSEPAEADQGGSEDSPLFRGYTEKTVLAHLCQALQPRADELTLGILPHPRENAAGLMDVWQRNRGRLRGGLIKASSGRQAVFAAAGVCGMTSLLLYEAWLLGKPVLSLQPNLKRPDLTFLKSKTGCHFIDGNGVNEVVFNTWFGEAMSAPFRPEPKPELNLHRGAPLELGRLVKDCGGY